MQLKLLCYSPSLWVAIVLGKNLFVRTHLKIAKSAFCRRIMTLTVRPTRDPCSIWAYGRAFTTNNGNPTDGVYNVVPRHNLRESAKRGEGANNPANRQSSPRATVCATRDYLASVSSVFLTPDSTASYGEFVRLPFKTDTYIPVRNMRGLQRENVLSSDFRRC